TGRAARNAPAVPTPVEVHEPSPTPMQLAKRALSPAIAPIETTFIVLVVTIFILLQREDLRDRLISLFGSRDLHRTTTAINDAAVRLSRYFVAQLGVNLSAGGVIAVGLAIIGVPGALLFGVIAALLRFVPYIGIWIAAILAVFLAAAIQPQWTMAVYTLLLFIVVDVVAGQIAEPLLYGHRSGLSPLAVVVAAIFWSWLWGPIGLVLSTPLTLCVVTLGRYADRLNFLTVLLGDQPALTPAQNFYQRLLADDPHEAIVQAERLLREMTLIDYYDNVALEGLKLARNDATRGVLMPEQLARVNEALVDIVENLEIAEGLPERPTRAESADPPTVLHSFAPSDLSERHDMHRHGQPSASGDTQKTAVLCVPGRGAFDEVTTAIAVQLLGRQGFAPIMATHSGYRAARADEPSYKSAPVICIVTLDAPDSPPYLRNMLRRTREWRPRAALVVGVGGTAESAHETGVGATAASHSAPTFRAMIEECQVAATALRTRAHSHITGAAD
ncbi:MAG TPA: AI-2E family transporter, partial [Paraburkholderia sp.]|uniref:AI-2E family transporter n=1 Tax=Paraburkholderia sp. TaxID=1926495 RepID=UPI002ED451EF